jgi:general secretion pathway protein K
MQMNCSFLTRSVTKRGPRRQDGIALIIVLTMIFFLGMLAFALASFMNVEVTLARRASFESEAEWLGRSGIELGRYHVAKVARMQTHNLGQRWAGGTGDTNDLGAASVPMENIEIGLGVIDKIHIEDLGSKMNINTLAEDPLGQQLLEQVLLQVTGDPVQAGALRDAIVDWVDPDDLEFGTAGAEKDYYLGLDPPYYPKNGRIDDMVEFLAIKGVNEAMYNGSSMQAVDPRTGREFEAISYPMSLKEVFTTLGVERKLININTAPSKTLELIFGFPDAASAIVTARNGPDGQQGTMDDGISVGMLASLPQVAWVLAQSQGPAIPPPAPQPNPNQPGAQPARPVAPPNLLGLLSDRSAYFEIAADIHVGNLRRTYYGIVDAARNPVEPVLLHLRWDETGSGGADQIVAR